MSEADVQHVRRTMEKWTRNERDAAWAGWSEDGTMNAPKEWPEAASSTGLDQVRAVFDGFDDAFGPDWPTHMHVAQLEDLGDGRVLAEFDLKVSGVSSGAAVDQEITGIYHVTKGKITHADFFTSHEEGRRAAGLE